MVRKHLARDVLFRIVVGGEDGHPVVNFEEAAVILAPEVRQRIVEIEGRRFLFRRIIIGFYPRRSLVDLSWRVASQLCGLAEVDVPAIWRHRGVLVGSGAEFVRKRDFDAAAHVGVDPRFPWDRPTVFSGGDRVIVSEAQALVHIHETQPHGIHHVLHRCGSAKPSTPTGDFIPAREPSAFARRSRVRPAQSRGLGFSKLVPFALQSSHTANWKDRTHKRLTHAVGAVDIRGEAFFDPLHGQALSVIGLVGPGAVVRFSESNIDLAPHVPRLFVFREFGECVPDAAVVLQQAFVYRRGEVRVPVVPEPSQESGAFSLGNIVEFGEFFQ